MMITGVIETFEMCRRCRFFLAVIFIIKLQTLQPQSCPDVTRCFSFRATTSLPKQPFAFFIFHSDFLLTDQ